VAVAVESDRRLCAGYQATGDRVNGVGIGEIRLAGFPVRVGILTN
jgi:hypothetical protein